jgi:hypothetical protein
MTVWIVVQSSKKSSAGNYFPISLIDNEGYFRGSAIFESKKKRLNTWKNIKKRC